METKNIFKPILFNTEMVQANLANRKNQTRRICMVDPLAKLIGLYTKRRLWNSDIEENPNPLMHFAKFDLNGVEVEVKSKYKKDDILWVRETTKVGAWREEECKIAFDYKASPELKKTPWCFFEEEKFVKLHLETIEALDKKGFEADIDEEREYCTYHWEPGESPLNWKPSLFMPKEATRIFLKVTNVRCERLQDISEEDAIAEGLEIVGTDREFIFYKNYQFPGEFHQVPRNSFLSLWDSINAKKHPWKSNPWVWVYDFERIEKPENFLL